MKKAAPKDGSISRLVAGGKTSSHMPGDLRRLANGRGGAMTWMKLEMSPKEARGQYEGLQEAFVAVFTAAGMPREAAMFMSTVASQDNAFYFSPAAAGLFAAVLTSRGAQACSKPAANDVTPLVSNGDPFKLLFNQGREDGA